MAAWLKKQAIAAIDRREFFRRQLGGFPERTPLNAKVTGGLTVDDYNIALNAEPQFLKGGRDGTIRMHFGNGPIMVAGKDCEVLGTYSLNFPTGKPAAILTGKCGKGNVVLFGTHPLGEKVSYKGTRAWFSGKLMETEKMFINALLYAAKLVDREGVALDSDRR